MSPDRPSVENALVEARRRFDEERDKYNTIMNKTGVLLAVNAILISIVGSSTNITGEIRYAVLMPTIFSAAIALWLLRPQEFTYPGKRSMSKYYQEAKQEEDEFQEQWLDNYIDSADSHRSENESRLIYFKFSFWFAVIAISIYILNILFPTVPQVNIQLIMPIPSEPLLLLILL